MHKPLSVLGQKNWKYAVVFITEVCVRFVFGSSHVKKKITAETFNTQKYARDGPGLTHPSPHDYPNQSQFGPGTYQNRPNAAAPRSRDQGAKPCGEGHGYAGYVMSPPTRRLSHNDLGWIHIQMGDPLTVSKSYLRAIARSGGTTVCIADHE